MINIRAKTIKCLEENKSSNLGFDKDFLNKTKTVNYKCQNKEKNNKLDIIKIKKRGPSKDTAMKVER